MRKINNNDTKKLEILYKQNKIAELIVETEKLLQIESGSIVLLNILGVANLKQNKYKEAEIIFKKILEKDFKNANGLKNLGETYRKNKNFAYAIKCYEDYLVLNPKDNEIINNLAVCYINNKKYKLGVDCYRNLIKNNPNNEEYKINLAFSLIESFDFDEGINILEKVLDKNITNKRAYSGYLFNQNYNPRVNFNKVNSYIEKYNKTYKKENFDISNFIYNKNPKKLNIGFISPDFRKHPVGYAIVNVIQNLRSYNFNLYGYYNFYIEDDITNKIIKSFDHFKNIYNYNDQQIVNKIRSDGIHILIDLAGHSENNNLTAFYYKPAPLQISWLGYLPTTGVKEIKYKIGDSYIYPKNEEKKYSENFLYLPGIWSDFAIDETSNFTESSSNYKNDEIILGSFVNLRKINDEVIKLWSKVLLKYPTTKLYFKSSELNDDLVKSNLETRFLKHNVKPDRLILEKSSSYESYLKSYLKVHITLDPFPWNGVTTSFESIWMGAPIFCLKGKAVYSRCAYSINKKLGMEEWIAEDENDFLIKLEKILSNKKKLFLIKKNLRENAIKKNLFNSKEFTKNLANKLNQVWKDFIIE